MKVATINTLFLDIGGVLLSNGWDRKARQRAVAKFDLNWEELNERHHLIFDIYEKGRLTLDQYLDSIVFYQPRPFSLEDFKAFIWEQSKPFEENLSFFKELKKEYQLKVIAVSNEGRELNAYRIKKFRLDLLFDAFISSCYVQLRKPDATMLQMACDISYSKPEEILYVDDRLQFVETARKFGMTSLHFQELNQAKVYIQSLSFSQEKTKQKSE